MAAAATASLPWLVSSNRSGAQISNLFSLPTSTASCLMPATLANSSGKQRRPTLSSFTWAELPPITRSTTAASSSESDISFNRSSKTAQRAGGNTNKYCCCPMGHGRIVNSDLPDLGRHLEGTMTRRDPSIPCRNRPVKTVAGWSWVADITEAIGDGVARCVPMFPVLYRFLPKASIGFFHFF